MNQERIKIAILEDIFIAQKVKSGVEVKALPDYLKGQLLDVMGKVLFDDEWGLDDEQVES